MIASLSGSIFKLLLLASEPLSLGQGMLLMVVVLIVVLALVAGGAYVFLRVFASLANKRRDSWEATAAELGLQIDRTSPHIVKPLEGVYKDHKVKIVSFKIRRDVDYDTHEHYISCETYFSKVLAFPFEIRSESRFSQAISSVFSGKGVKIGLPSFDNAFHIESPAPDDLRKMLVFEPPGGQQTSVLTDLVLVLNRSHSVEINDSRIKITARDENIDTAGIRTIIDDTILLAERLQTAYAATHTPVSVLFDESEDETRELKAE